MDKYKLLFFVFLVILIVYFILAKTSAISEPIAKFKKLPCSSPVANALLGSPIVGGPVAEFTTNGDPIYLSARTFSHTGIFGEFGGSAKVDVGNITSLPTYDAKRSIVTSSISGTSLNEGEYVEITLPAGRYWLWSSSISGAIQVASCSPNGVSDPKSVNLAK